MKREVEMEVKMTFYLEENKVKEFKDGYDGDAKGEPVDATKVRQEHFPCVPGIWHQLDVLRCIGALMPLDSRYLFFHGEVHPWKTLWVINRPFMDNFMIANFWYDWSVKC